jgi:ATP-dependent Lhr-like helicase
VLGTFHPIIQRWFEETLGAPTAAQRRAWDAIRQGRHTLVSAPTGSGKTLAAFLIALDDLLREGLETALPDEVRTVYVSPLKALSSDIHKNLAEPRTAIRRLAAEMGLDAPRITAAVRTGDTPASERAAMLRTPPHVLVTTPESLYLLLTAERSRERLRTVRTVIVDEIHAVIGTRRGAHLALTLERLAHVAGRPLQRIGLSATQNPVDEVARFLVGSANVDDDGRADCVVVDEGHRREIDLGLELPGSPLEAVMSHEVWGEYYDRLATLIAAHKTTLVFVNTRKMVERVARCLSERVGESAIAAHHGSLAKDRRLDAESRLKRGELKALVATASLELGIDIGHVDLVCQVGSPHRIATFLQRVGRAGHTIHGTPKGRLFPVSRDDLVECAALLRAVRRGELDRLIAYEAPLDVLSQQLVAESACDEWREDDLAALVRRAWPYRHLARADFDAVVSMLASGFTTRRGRRAALVHRDEVQRRVLGRRSARLTALTAGGAIPDLADYRVLLEPDDLLVGTLNEDFAIESNAGDVFQLGNSSWRILQVASGVVRVTDAHGAPPTLPFWLGEAPARSAELSSGVSELRREIAALLGTDADTLVRAADWLVETTGIPRSGAEQVVAYFAESMRILGTLPTQQTLVLERFFDESGGMQLVLHAPFGSRVNRAWALALRKRFCRQFNFELQAAATEEGLLLSLGPQHAFPLADVFRYLHPTSVRDVLIQAFLDAPVFQTRWRWNATISLAVPRSRGGSKVPSPLQRMQAEDLLAAAFPDAAACLENIPGDRQIPDHPLVAQTVRDCLEEAMDLPRLVAILERIHRGDLTCIARDTPEPSPLCHELLNARPYAFLDDAPLEERRTQAVYARRATDLTSGGALGALDAAAIAQVGAEAWPDPRDADELHDALVTAGFLSADEVAREPRWRDWLETLASAGRVTCVSWSLTPSQSRGLTPPFGSDPMLWVSAERLPELLAARAGAMLHPVIAAPRDRAAHAWTRETAIIELLRGRLALVGPVTAAALGTPLGLDAAEADAALLALEAEGVVLRGSFTAASFTAASAGLEWCDRRLLARIHRLTLNRLRAEIEPVSPADFMRFLFAWQHVTPAAQLTGLDGVRAVLTQLDGYELAAGAWERDVLPARVRGYTASALDQLCYAGDAAWGRLSGPLRPGRLGAGRLWAGRLGAGRLGAGQDEGHTQGRTRPIRSTPVSLFLRPHADAWRLLAAGAGESEPPESRGEASPAGSESADRIVDRLRRRGASFAHEMASALSLTADEVQQALAELVALGLVTSDGFGGLRAMFARRNADARHPGRFRSRMAAAPASAGGRWSLLCGDADPESDLTRESAVERYARVLLARYGIVFRRLLAREPFEVSWRELVGVFRRLEARGEIRGGRFVAGMSGEQFALPEAIESMREIRRTPASGALLTISGADPLNLVGIVTADDRIAAVGATRVAWRDGVALAVMEGDYVRQLHDYEPEAARAVSSALAGRATAAVMNGFVGRTV